MRKFCPPPMIILMDFLFIFLFILLYTSSNDTTIRFELSDAFPSDLLPKTEFNSGIKIVCPQVYNECNSSDYLIIPEDLTKVIASVVLNSLLPPKNCKTINIPLTRIINGRTWLDQEKLIKINDCLRKSRFQ